MSGLPDKGKSKLDEAHQFLLSIGRDNNTILNPYHMVDNTKEVKWCECMKIDIKQICILTVSGMVLVDNWASSKGAVLEVILFLVLGIPIYNIFGENITADVFKSFTQEFLYDMFAQMVATHHI